MKGLLCLKYTNAASSNLVKGQNSYSDLQNDISIREASLLNAPTVQSSLIIKLYRLYSDGTWGKFQINKLIDGIGPNCQLSDLIFRVFFLNSRILIVFMKAIRGGTSLHK